MGVRLRISMSSTLCPMSHSGPPLLSLPSIAGVSLQHAVDNGSRWVVQRGVDLIAFAGHHRSHLVVCHQVADIHKYTYLLAINLAFGSDNGKYSRVDKFRQGVW